MLSFLLVVLGVALLYYGGDLLVGNSIHLARSFGISRMVIGLTVVAFATSSPELAATLTAAYRGSPDIAIGNVLGSNVANLGLILGCAATIVPLHVHFRFVRREVAFMVLVTILMYPLLATGLYLGRLEGLFLIFVLAVFLYTLIKDPESQKVGEEIPTDEVLRPAWVAALGVAAGIALLVGGAQALVAGASQIARDLGVAERVIGLTLVALGTSLPELAASLVAARRRESDLVIGNVIGSNVFNLLCILGFTSLIHPITVAPAALGLDFWVVLGISVLVLVMLATQRRLVRVEGAILLLIYLGYTLYLFRS
jgi:cation:H+ antiporter